MRVSSGLQDERGRPRQNRLRGIDTLPSRQFMRSSSGLPAGLQILTEGDRHSPTVPDCHVSQMERRPVATRHKAFNSSTWLHENDFLMARLVQW